MEQAHKSFRSVDPLQLDCIKISFVHHNFFEVNGVVVDVSAAKLLLPSLEGIFRPITEIASPRR